MRRSTRITDIAPIRKQLWPSSPPWSRRPPTDMMEKTHAFSLEGLDEISYSCSADLAGMYKLSPFVWREGEHFEMLLRVVNHSDNPSEKVARIHRGVSLDGLRFALGEEPVIAPGNDVPGSLDSGGCEDPTVAYADGF